MNPTKQQINQAERLQAAGLCQNTDLIIYGKGEDYSFADHGSKFARTAEKRLPLPNFEEVHQEIQNKTKEEEFVLELWSEGLIFKTTYGKINKAFFYSNGYNLTTAAIEALLLLKGEG